MSLVALDEETETAQISSSGRVPLEWVNYLDEAQYELARIRSRLKQNREMRQNHISKPRAHNYCHGIEVPIMYPLPANRGPSLVWSEKNPDFKFCDFPIWMKLKSGQPQSVHQVVSNNFLTHLVSPDQLWRLDHDHLS
ncbi:unnamed protein product [Onchocerca ochengi]|uniref:Uncharacterized protein n=1 Tax=Onchocerca ochengi TaxID=42157 RepID=A0A182EH39_ONCOC|nr:unnamed protein product [Onchocerca ochengi]